MMLSDYYYLGSKESSLLEKSHWRKNACKANYRLINNIHTSESVNNVTVMVDTKPVCNFSEISNQ